MPAGANQTPDTDTLNNQERHRLRIRGRGPTRRSILEQCGAFTGIGQRRSDGGNTCADERSKVGGETIAHIAGDRVSYRAIRWLGGLQLLCKRRESLPVTRQGIVELPGGAEGVTLS